jgi:hypothetical protein
MKEGIIGPLLLTRTAVIVLAIVAAVLVSASTGLRLARKGEGSKLSQLLIYVGYTCFILSIVLFIIIGFAQPRQ